MSALLDKFINLCNIPKWDIHNYLPGNQNKNQDTILTDYHLTRIAEHYYFRHNRTRDIYLCLQGDVYFYILAEYLDQVHCVLPLSPTNNLQHHISEKIFMNIINNKGDVLMAGKLSLDDGLIKSWRPFDTFTADTGRYYRALDSDAIKSLLTLHLID
ncbi:hypothetical protein ACWQEN_004002 [Morganella morganii]|uniref:hypothetical protein n=1 Tax=Morganella morganii TaxID=582 RepID=UPI001E31BC4D|nr:hypothetical protein [Morganella morganii]UFH67655.1 hypothetical protein KQH80_15110 [Morganella morganii]